jgi:hypothetical protein
MMCSAALKWIPEENEKESDKFEGIFDSCLEALLYLHLLPLLEL